MILSPALLTSSTFWPSCLAVLAYVLASVWPQAPSSQGNSQQERPVWAALCLGWMAQAVAIVLDTVAFDGPEWRARFGFAPALSVTTWLVLAVYALENRRLGLPSVRRAWPFWLPSQSAWPGCFLVRNIPRSVRHGRPCIG